MIFTRAARYASRRAPCSFFFRRRDAFTSLMASAGHNMPSHSGATSDRVRLPIVEEAMPAWRQDALFICSTYNITRPLIGFSLPFIYHHRVVLPTLVPFHIYGCSAGRPYRNTAYSAACSLRQRVACLPRHHAFCLRRRTVRYYVAAQALLKRQEVQCRGVSV